LKSQNIHNRNVKRLAGKNKKKQPLPERQDKINKSNIVNNMNALTNTDFHFDGQTNVYHGKVRDVYTVKKRLACNDCHRPYFGLRRGFT